MTSPQRIQQVRRITRAAWISAALVIAAFLSGGSAIPAETSRMRLFSSAVAGWGFDLVAWEVEALGDKAYAAVTQPAGDLPPRLAALAVLQYMHRADEIGKLTDLVNRGYSEAACECKSSIWTLQTQLEGLREEQIATRPTVEQVIQRQVSNVLEVAGFTVAGTVFPPVQFTFTEPPKKLVVSPRDRIATIYTRMLAADIGIVKLTEAEDKINAASNARGYITNIGGLGAYPTMVVDQASLGWILSTVAHEWVHNYLALYPLGWSYFKSQDLTTLNETVAEIAGNEIGRETLRQYYPQLVKPLAQEPPSSEALPLADPDGFDFNEQMRLTRLEVDSLLAAGKVDEAEAYMEQRRQAFVEHGYPLRVLNQAYFAFHGSYGTSAASTSPIGPKLERLRSLSPDLRSFMDTVKWFISLDDLDAALADAEDAAARIEG